MKNKNNKKNINMMLSLFMIILLLINVAESFEGSQSVIEDSGTTPTQPSSSTTDIDTEAENYRDNVAAADATAAAESASKTAAAIAAAKSALTTIYGGISSLAGAWDSYVSHWGDLGHMFGLGDDDNEPWSEGLYSVSNTLSPDTWSDNMCEYIRTDMVTSASSFVITETGDQAMHIEGYKIDYEGYVSCDPYNTTDSVSPECKAAFGSNVPCSGEGLCGTNTSPKLLTDYVYMITFEISGDSSVIRTDETLQAVIKLDNTIMDITRDWKNGTWNNQNDVMHIKSGSDGYKFGGVNALYIPQQRIGGGSSSFEKACICITDTNVLTNDVKEIYDELAEGGCLCNPFVKEQQGLTPITYTSGFNDVDVFSIFSIGTAASSFEITQTSSASTSSSSSSGGSDCESTCIQ